MQCAVITGPTGVIGTALCKKLLSENIKVYAVCRKNSMRLNKLSKETEIIFCDLSELSSLPDKINRADVFFHLGWANTIGVGRNDMYSQNENIRFTLDAVNAAKKLGCECFIGAGSQSEYGRHNHLLKADTPCFPETGYGIAKFCAGKMSRIMCEQLGMRHLWARILSVYGPNDGEKTMISYLISSLLNGEEPELTEGSQMWDYLFSYDAAEALYLMWKNGQNGSVYPLGSGIIRPLREYAEIVRDTIDSKMTLGIGKIPYSKKQVMFLGADIGTLKKDIGFTPSYTFEEGIKLTVESVGFEK